MGCGKRIVLMSHNLRVAGGLSVGKSIVATLPKIAPSHTYLVLAPSGCGYKELCEGEHVTVQEIAAMPLPRRVWFDAVELPKIVAAFEPDIAWGLGNLGLKHPPCKQAILLHDPHLIYPVRHYRRDTRKAKILKRLLKGRLQQCLAETDIVFCQTETARQRFAKTFRFGGRICLCPNAISPLVKTSADPGVPPALRPYADRFKLFVLTKYCAHKNIEGLVETYAAYRDDLADTLCVLTISADQHPNAPGVLRSIQRHGLTEHIITVGRIEQEQLGDYYLACDALLLPTFLESFTGTYIEAMQFGRPILTSDLDFAHEVCRDAAEYFDPWDTGAIRDAIVRLRDNSKLRQELVERGQRIMASRREWPEILRTVMDELGVACL